jgi:hypothetical protein
MKMPKVLGVSSSWEVFHEPLGFHKFWWDLELGDWNPNFLILLLPWGLICFHVFVGFGCVGSRQLNT